MKTRLTHSLRPSLTRMRRFQRLAFSLIEVLVVVALMSFIIIGLVTMFSQTQRAYKLGTTQVDVLEAGRAVTDMMTREFSQMAPAYQSNNINTFGAVNFEIVLHTNGPFLQTLPGMPATDRGRTNLMADVFFYTKENQRWSGIGYQILDPDTGKWPQGGVGTLYRFETNAYYRQYPVELYAGYTKSWYTNGNMTKLLDGVVHFKVHAFDTNGMWLNQSVGTNTAANIAVNYDPSFLRDEPFYSRFFSNAVPASVEIELGILEDRSLERLRSIGNLAVRAEFLRTNLVGKVHLFRWRVPVRNVDPSAYQ